VSFFFCLVAKHLLKVPLPKLAHMLWSLGKGTKLVD
jgi:hypothetical protein